MTLTKGNVIVENIKVGDIHFEYDHGSCLKVEVLEVPTKDSEGNFEWKAKVVSTGEIVDYFVNPKYQHYSPNLYDYEAYERKVL